MFLRAGKYYYSKGGSSEILKKDTPIKEIIEVGNCVYVTLEGFDYGSFAVFDKTKILPKARTRKVVLRKKPCYCPNFNFGKTEWMAGVPIYCKSMDCRNCD